MSVKKKFQTFILLQITYIHGNTLICVSGILQICSPEILRSRMIVQITSFVLPLSVLFLPCTSVPKSFSVTAFDKFTSSPNDSKSLLMTKLDILSPHPYARTKIDTMSTFTNEYFPSFFEVILFRALSSAFLTRCIRVNIGFTLEILCILHFQNVEHKTEACIYERSVARHKGKVLTVFFLDVSLKFTISFVS